MLAVPGVMTRRRRLVALISLVLLVVTGCRVQLEVEIDVDEDGSGTVTAGVGLDADAQARIPDVSQLLVTADLEAAGWEVRPPQLLSDGLLWVQAEKDFADSEELQVVLDELFGPSSGVFSDWEVIADSMRTKKTFDVVGRVDLSDGLVVFADDDLLVLLDEPPLGVNLDELEAELEQPIEETVDLRVVVKLPGGDAQTTVVAMGETQDVVASSVSENRVAQLLGWVATALLVLFGLSLLLAALNYFLDRRYSRNEPTRRPQPVAERVPGGPQGAPVGGAAAAPAAAARSALQLIVLDAHDVLFRNSSDPTERLLPFIREHGGTATDEEIFEYHRQATLGRLQAAGFWTASGVEGDPNELDAKYLSTVRLQQGAKEFLREMHRRGVPVAVISNDLAEWSYRLRDLHGLGGVAPWIVSSEIGVRKPDPAAYEALRRVTGVPYHSILMVDGQIPSLDMARTLGMMTSWFAKQKPPDGAEPGHAVVLKFADFFRRRRPAEPVDTRRRARSR